jgi:hypothetical protein
VKKITNSAAYKQFASALKSEWLMRLAVAMLNIIVLYLLIRYSLIEWPILSQLISAWTINFLAIFITIGAFRSEDPLSFVLGFYKRMLSIFYILMNKEDYRIRVVRDYVEKEPDCSMMRQINSDGSEVITISLIRTQEELAKML